MAGQLGVTVEQVGRSFAAATSSSRFVAPNYWADPRTGIAFQVQIEVPQPQMTSLDDLRVVPVSGGSTVARTARRRRRHRERDDRRRIRSHQRAADGHADRERRRTGPGADGRPGRCGDCPRRRAAARSGGRSARPDRGDARNLHEHHGRARRGRRRHLSAAGCQLPVAAARVRRRVHRAGRPHGRGPDAGGDAHDVERAVVHGRHHGDRRRGRQCHSAGDVCRAGARRTGPRRCRPRSTRRGRACGRC